MHCLVLAACAVAQAQATAPAADPPPAALTDYVSAPDATFKWVRAGDPVVMPDATVHTLKMTSQTWHGVAWEHDLQLVVPKGVPAGGTVLLWNQGGGANALAAGLAAALAEKTRLPVAFLYGVPKQPLFGGKSEDALIAETFVKYLQSGDPTWPLLFPMTKSVVRAMDAVQQFAKAELKADVTGFVVTGASKRGWTAWLTAATGDPRVKAVAPLVIDTLNFPAQMKNQLAAFGGKPSRMIEDYVRAGLVPIPKSDRADALWKMVDPYSYRAKLTLPKLLIHGANDPYWPVDALSSYWDGLPGEKYLLVVPNAGHDLRERDEKGAKQVIPDRAVNTLAAFARAVGKGDKFLGKAKAPTAVIYDRQGTGSPFGGGSVVGADGATLTFSQVDCERPKRLWTADGPTRDFRQARWTVHDIEQGTWGGQFGPGFAGGGRAGDMPPRTVTVTVSAPNAGFRAGFVEFDFGPKEGPFRLSLPVVVVPAKPK